ncbi:MAG TPA: Holliday junction resolvase RuvX [Anaerolineaceae bacterium]|jgi:putative Holliday junction resolvase|nr:Holliday junction resolvase RuvX [Anaerolineaceae bacterium]
MTLPPGRVLAVDPGEKRIGLAISDPTATIARPLMVLPHVARLVDAAEVARLARENDAVGIVVGCPLDADGQPGPAARRSQRFAEALRQQTDLPILLWDESGSTQTARAVRREMGVRRRDRQGHLDDLAALIILQSYLEAGAT